MQQETVDHTNIDNMFIIMIMIFLIIYMLVGTTLAKYNIKVIHESIVIIVLSAVVINLIRLLASKDENANFIERINTEYILEALLPIIILKEGFSLKQKSFFKNISYIIGFGFFGTILNVVMLTAGFYGQNMLISFKEWFNLEQNFFEILTMAVVLSNADTLAPLALIDSDKHPDIFSVVFGEGVLNDAVVLIAFETLKKNADHAEEYFENNLASIFTDFFLCALYSLLVGILCGVLSTLVNKWYRDIQGHVFMEITIVLCTGVITFFICEMTFFKLSGIVCIFIFGIFQANYNLYNLSPKAQQKIEDILEQLAYVSEAIIFLFLGCRIGQYEYTGFNFFWAPLTVVLMIVVRFIIVYSTWPIVSLITPAKAIVGCKEIFIIVTSGMIRGAISFALVLILQEDATDGLIGDHLVANIQLIVLITIFVFTPQNAMLQPCVLKNKKSFVEQKKSDNAQTLLNVKDNQTCSNNIVRQDTYNQDIELQTLKLDTRKGCRKYMYILNEMIIKPLLIFNYKHRTTKEKPTLVSNIKSRPTWKGNFNDISRKTRAMQGENMKEFKNKFSYEGIKIIEDNPSSKVEDIKKKINLSDGISNENIFFDIKDSMEPHYNKNDDKKVTFKDRRSERNAKKYSSDFITTNKHLQTVKDEITIHENLVEETPKSSVEKNTGVFNIDKSTDIFKKNDDE